MTSIFGTILLGILLALTPAIASAQPPLQYNADAGAVTDITGGVYDPGTIVWLPSGGYINVCPPTVSYGRNDGFGSPPRQTGGDGVWATADTMPLNTGGRTETTYAVADALGGVAKAFAAADTSSPCIVFANGSVEMSAFGLGTAQFYRTFTVVSSPRSAQIDMDWSLRGSFSNLTSSGGGSANLQIYLLVGTPLKKPAYGIPFSGGGAAVVMVGEYVNSRTSEANLASCLLQGCTPPQKAPLVSTRGSIDVRQVFEDTVGRPMTIGDTFAIGVLLTVWTRTCGSSDGGWCAPLPRFTTDFRATANVRTSGESIR